MRRVLCNPCLESEEVALMNSCTPASTRVPPGLVDFRLADPSPSDDFGAALADLQLPPEDVRLFGRGFEVSPWWRRAWTARPSATPCGDWKYSIRSISTVAARESAEADGVADQTSPVRPASPPGRPGLRRPRSFAGMGALGGAPDDLGTADQRADRPSSGWPVRWRRAFSGTATAPMNSPAPRRHRTLDEAVPAQAQSRRSRLGLWRRRRRL